MAGRETSDNRQVLPDGDSWRGAAETAERRLEYRETRRLLDYWRSLGDATRPPRRADLEPERMAGFLAHIWLMDYVPDSGRLRYRLIGDQVRQRYDKAVVGKYLDEVVEAEAYPQVARYFLACPEVPAISMLMGRLYQEWPRPGFGERLLLPLFSDNGAAEALIGITICKKTYSDREAATRDTARVMRILPLNGADPIEEVT